MNDFKLMGFELEWNQEVVCVLVVIKYVVINCGVFRFIDYL